MFIPPLMTLLKGAATPAPFYQATKTLSSDWNMALGPAALHVTALNKTIVTWTVVGAGGHKSVQAASYDHATNSWSERYVVGNYDLADDDHGHPAITQDADGFFYVFYGSHASSLHWSISTIANDISAWTQQTALSSSQTYPHPNFVGTSIYLMTRNETVALRSTWALRTATPSAGSATFSAMSIIVDFAADSRCDTGEAITVGTDIHFVSTRCNASDTARKGVYYFVYDTATGAVKNHDGSVSVASGSLPVDLTTANASFRLFDHGSNQGEVPSLCFDTAGDPHILFADGTATTYNLKHIKRTSGTWSSPATVDSISDEIGGSGFTTLYSIVAGPSGTVEAWYINASGDKLRKVRSSSGTWGALQTILLASTNEIRSNQPVRNAASKLRTIFCEVSGYPSSDASAVLSKRYAYGDGGPVLASVPMSSIDASWASVAMLLGFESRDTAATSFINEADSCRVVTAGGNAQVDTAQAKFGSASLLLDGTGDFLSTANSSLFSVSGGDFTVECWVRRNASKLQCVCTKKPTSGSSEWAMFINASNQLQCQAFDASVAVVNITSSATIANATWTHIALSRSGTTWRQFIDGSLDGSATESAAPTSNTRPMLIGRDEAFPARDFNGWIDEFRFTSGVARYTAGFTAPVAAFPRR